MDDLSQFVRGRFHFVTICFWTICHKSYSLFVTILFWTICHKLYLSQFVLDDLSQVIGPIYPRRCVAKRNGDLGRYVGPRPIAVWTICDNCFSTGREELSQLYFIRGRFIMNVREVTLRMHAC